MKTDIVTRFAPSPTGFLHIGGARTALFNWLYSRHFGGKMLLRIEDTDRQRSTQEAVDAIKSGLAWMGLDWDGEAISQFESADEHRKVAQQMVVNGTAYYCYASQEENDEARALARQKGEKTVYAWRNRDPSSAPNDVKPVIRLKAPEDGVTVVHDLVQGDVTFENKNLDDLILCRADGSPTYMLAVVVDDHQMGVTHIIRGDDHLTNAARQILIYQAMNWSIPQMAHIPLIHGSDGAKLSKRHGALGVEAYREMGYLPQTLRNYLVRLGWSHGDQEIFSLEEMIELFDVDKIGKSASRLDLTKLEKLNTHYIQNTNEAELMEQLIKDAPFLSYPNNLATLIGEKREFLAKAMPLIKEKSKTLNDLAQAAETVMVEQPVSLDEKATKILNDEAKTILAGLLPDLESVEDWNTENISMTVRNYGEKSGFKLGQVAQPIRCSLVGTPKAPGVFELMELLGKRETLDRIGVQSNLK